MKHCIHRIGQYPICCWCGYAFAYLPAVVDPENILLEHGPYSPEDREVAGADEDCPVRIKLNALYAINAT